MTTNTIKTHSFIDLGKELNKPMTSKHAQVRAEKFDAEFSSYELTPESMTYIDHKGSTRVMTLADFVLRCPQPSLLPDGNGRIDKVVDGANETTKTVTTDRIKYLQTAIEYRNSTIEQASLETVRLYDQIQDALANKKSTKSDYESILLSIADALLPTAKREVYLSMFGKEKTLSVLEKFGFTYGEKSHRINEETGQHQYCATVSQENMKQHNKEIASYIEFIGKPVPQVNDDFEVESFTLVFALKDQE